MKNDKKEGDFDFDQWATIARQDPEQFERMRQQLINEVIAQSPEHLKQRMEGLQWQIDQIRKQSSSPGFLPAYLAGDVRQCAGRTGIVKSIAGTRHDTAISQ